MMTTPPPTAAHATPPFDTNVDTSFNASADAARDDVESPSLTNGNALARFEFEPGRSKDGTKVLMVEWEEDETTRSVSGDWEISWEGKRTVLPARDQPPQQYTDPSQAQEPPPVNRLYFLLGPGVTIPTSIKLRKGPQVTWRTNPLPAIFSPELGATARQAGKKGVLHTIWAKKRLQVLQKEIEDEENKNVEGIGLEMAQAEKEWIESNFGVIARPGSISVASMGQGNAALQGVLSNSHGGLNSPVSPRSPGGGRLMDKLKGLKLGTSVSDLSSTAASGSGGQTQQGGAGTANGDSSYHNPLSPEISDVAVGGFGSFAALKGMPPASTLAAKVPQRTEPDTPQPARRVMAARPPESFVAQQRSQIGGMGSLNAFAASGADALGISGAQPQDEGEEQDDLFALPMSPRSPEMTKSPFSFATQDTMKYLKEESAPAGS